MLYVCVFVCLAELLELILVEEEIITSLEYKISKAASDYSFVAKRYYTTPAFSADYYNYTHAINTTVRVCVFFFYEWRKLSEFMCCLAFYHVIYNFSVVYTTVYHMLDKHSYLQQTCEMFGV